VGAVARPTPASGFRVQKSRQIPEVLAGVTQIDDLNRAREVLVCDVPDPLGPVADDHFLLGAAPASIPCLQEHTSAELGGCFNGSGVSSRIGIANSVAFLVPCSLGESASQFDFACLSGLALHLAFSSLRFCHRYSSAVHLKVEERDRLAHHHGEIQLYGSLDLLPLAGGDVFAYPLR
jgi:hypothetical protein